jgi:hypothetical protein
MMVLTCFLLSAGAQEVSIPDPGIERRHPPGAAKKPKGFEFFKTMAQRRNDLATARPAASAA